VRGAIAGLVFDRRSPVASGGAGGTSQNDASGSDQPLLVPVES
jgi:hypothetical protein